ncbi:MAG: sigma 54-interacting transcriptional regulator [Clostridiales Family XIII bacterium]|jgi:transcriptional regulator with PAS, ATPase and Fis domain|nr:sigma 54-interacting transcriptional regulator [Clostridiales Family XIII bacterium]
MPDKTKRIGSVGGPLSEVRETVQKYAEIVSRLASIDVEVVDKELCRVAGTGIFSGNVNVSIAGEANIYRHTMRTGQVQFVADPRENALCEGCELRDSCVETIEISEPILMENEVIGVIGLVGSTEEQREKMLENRDIYLDLLNQIAHFIAGKAQDRMEARRRDAVISTLDSVINHVAQGILILGADGIITNANDTACRLFGGMQLEGLAANLERTGDSINRGHEYRIRVRKKELLVYGRLHDIPRPAPRFSQVLIFSESGELLDQVYGMTSVVREIEVDGIMGDSRSTQILRKEITKVARSKSTVLITGESGTGKEVVATAVWKMSGRKDNKFVAINCGAIPEALLEAELFGYVKGAFTGADPNGRIGKFELADGGVLFLDEIGDMPLYLQVKLLRVLQERSIERIGSNRIIPIDVRVIAATNQDLKEMIAEKKFREDLYYRLNVIPIHIDPLRTRPEDIPALVHHFAARYAGLFGKNLQLVDEGVVELLSALPWPGNVRELENTVEFMVNMMEEDGILDVRTLPATFEADARHVAEGQQADHSSRTPAPERRILTIRELESREIERALELYGRSTAGKRRAADALGMSLASLYRKL